MTHHTPLARAVTARTPALRRYALAITLVLCLFAILPTASAHGYVVRAIPEDRAVLERPPARLQYWFSEALEPDFSNLNVRDQNGDIIATGGVAEDDNALMTVRLPNDLPDGAYIVELRPAFASDGHVVAESRVFFVGEEVGGVAGQAATNRAVPLEVVWRSMVIMAVVLLFGTFTLYAVVLVPAWGNANYRAGLLPPRVMKRLSVIVGYALLLAFLGNGLALIQQTMVFFNIDFTRALDRNFWSLVRIGSRFGDIWNWRMVFLGGVGTMFLASLYFNNRQPETVRPFWVANGWLMALILGTFSVLSHAAGSLLWPWAGIVIDWLHLAAVSAWVGGLAAMVLVLPVALAPYDAETRRVALLTVLRRFSRLAAAALFIVIATGVYSASNWVFGPAEIQSAFGGALLIKILLMLSLVALGALHHFTLHPERFAQFTGLINRVQNFMPTLRLEVIAAVLVLLAASTLSATPVPVPEFAQQEVKAPTEVFTQDDFTVVMTISPGGPGVNTYDTTVTRDGQRVEGLTINIQKVHPARDTRSDPHAAEAVEPGLYVSADDAINTTGRWWTLLDITDENGDQQRVALAWDITDEAAVIQSIDPGVTNLLAVVAVIAAVFAAVYASLRRFVNLLDLNPVIVTVAILAVVLPVGALVVANTIIEESRADYDTALNPLPEVINAVLPTQASLDRGAALYAEHCIDWQAIPRDFNALRDRLLTIRNDELFYAVRDGWRDLPPCAGDLTLYQRWDIVNYLRTLARP